jgi:hypothetical protein
VRESEWGQLLFNVEDDVCVVVRSFSAVRSACPLPTPSYLQIMKRDGTGPSLDSGNDNLKKTFEKKVDFGFPRISKDSEFRFFFSTPSL